MAEEKIASLTVDGTGALSTLDQIDAKMEKVGGTVETNTRRLTSFGRDFQQIARSLGVYTDAWERVKRVQEAAQRAVDSGRISQEQANRVIEEAKLRYDETARAAKQAADEQERAGAEAARANAAAAQSLEQIRRQYDPTYAAAAKYRDEVARVSKAMEAAGVTGHEYAATLRAVAAALDPVTRAEREREEATARAAIETARAEQRAADETERARREMIEKARALQIAADAQDRYNRLLGISDLPSGSAASSASVFQESARAAEEEAQAQAALADELDRVRTRYDATYAEVRRYVTEMNRVTRVLELANASEEERARLLAAVAAEYDPIIKAENERAAAEQRAQEEAAQATAEMIERERATQRAADAQHRYNELLGVSSTRSSASRSAAVFEDADQQAQALQRLVDRLEPAAAAQRRFADQQRQLDDALAGGKIDEAAHTRLTKALKDQETAYYGAAVGARAHSRALQVLVPQLSDIAVQAQSGTGAFTILVQQGPQIAEGLAFAGKEAMVAAARFALMAAPVLAVGAGFATAIYGAMRFSSEVREAERVLALTGGAAGVSAQMIVGMSDALADSAHVSRSTAREIQTAYAGTGKIGRQMMVELTQQTRNWALSTGQETDKAAAELAAMFADPAKAADELVAKYGMLDPAQARLIKNYQAQGELGKAQAVLLDGITPRISNATSRVSALAEAYEWAARGVSNFIDSAGRGFAAEGPTVAALKAAADKAAREHQLDPNGYNWVNGAKLSTKEIADYTEQAYGEAFRKAEADSWFAAIGEADAEFRRLKKSVMDFAASVDPAIGAAQAYTNRQVELEKAVRTGATSQSEATRLLKLYRAQLLETMSPAQAFGEEMERQGRVLREQAGVLRDYESARQNELKKRGLKPSDTLPQRVEDSLYDGVLSLSKDRAADTHRSMVQATEDARELAAATASGSQAALIAAQAQVAYNKTLRETKDVGLARQAYSDAYEKGMTEWRGQLDASVTAAGVAVESARRLAAAQAKGGDIAMAQAQAQNVYAENIARGVDPTRALALAQAELQKSMASLEGQRAAWNRDLGEQIDAARRLAEAEGVSAAAVAEANVQNKVRAQILKEGVSAESDRARAIEAGTRALEAQNAIARVNATIRQGNRDLTLARAEYELLGRSNAERERAVAIMKATLEVQESAEWQAVPKATRDAWVAQAGAVAEYQARIADATETSRDFASTITKGFEDAIVAGGKLSDIAKGLEADFKRIIVRTIATKPMENLLTGSLTKLLAGAPSGDAKVKPVSASDPGGYRAAFEQLTGGKAGTLGTQSNPMIVQLAGGGQGITIGGVSGGGMLPVAVKDAGAFGAIADEMAAKYGVDAAIIKGIIQRESSWNASAVNSRSGAAGLMQVMPANWSAYGITNPYDPRQNIEAGTRIFREHLNRAGGDLDRALSTYSGHIKTSGAAYVSAVKDSAETYRRAGTTFQAVSTNAQSVATSQAVQIQAQQEGAATTQNLTAAQSDAVSAALSAVKSMDSASTAAEDIDARLGVASDGVSTAAEKLAAAQKQAAQSAVLFAQSSQQAGAYMVDGTQQALGALLSIAGAASGIKGGGIPGQVVQAGGPQGIANSFSQLGSLLKTDGIFGSNSAVSGVKSFLNSPMSASFSSYTAPQAASVAKTSTGMLAGGEGASTGMGTQAAGGGATWGDALGAVGYGFNAFQNFQQGNVIGGIGNTAAAVMMFIPGLQPFAPLVAIGSQLLGGLFGPNRGKPAAAAAVEYTNTKQTYAASAIDNEGDAEQAQQLLQSIDAATKQFIGITGGKTNGGFGIAVEAKEDKYRVRNGGAAGELGASYDTLDEAVIAGFRHNIAAGLVTVSDDVKTAVGKTTVKDINEFMADVSFGKNFRAQFDALNASL
ncbi:MAG: phage tail length tape measure family protein, partial [Alphaproteobacteria bacterium]